MPTPPARTSRTRQQVRHAGAHVGTPCAEDFRIAGLPTAPGRSIASAVIFASARRWATASQSSLGRPSIGTSTTAGAGRCEALEERTALTVRPSSARNVTPRPAANAGDAIRQISRIADPKGPAPHDPVRAAGSSVRAHGQGRAALHRQTARTSRYSRTLCARPTNSAWLISAWPIDTSSRCGRRRNIDEIVRDRDRVRRSRRGRARAQVSAARGVIGERRACAAASPTLERARKRLGVQLDAVGAHSRRPADGVLVRDRRRG